MAELDALNLELLSIYPVECLEVGRLGFYVELLVTLSVPIVAALSAFTLVVAMRWAAGRLYFFPDARRRCPRWVAFRLENNAPGWPGLLRSWNQPRMYKLLTWVCLIMYPSMSRKALAIFDCVPMGLDELGAEIRVLRDDPVLPEGQCYTPAWNSWVGFAGFGLAVFCLGLPLAALYLSARYQFFGVYGDVQGRERVTLLVSSYKERYWYAESLSLLHRFVFTGLIHLIEPESRVQLWAGTLMCFLVFVMFMLTLPYRHVLCDWVQAAASS